MKTTGPVECLRRLIEGNDRFSRGLRSVESFTSIKTLSTLSSTGQKPFVMILACSDSRVPTEVIFDQKLGDIFVVRLAGNVVTPMVLASMEYAAHYFGIQLCVVLGHSLCGAVTAALQASKDPGVLKGMSPSIRHLVSLILPACSSHGHGKKRKDSKKEELSLDAIIQNHSRNELQGILKHSPYLAEKVRKEEMLLVSSVFNIAEGKVEFDLPLHLQPMLRLAPPFFVHEIPRLKVGGSQG